MKTVGLNCGHDVEWKEWGKKGDFPTIWRWAWCDACAKEDPSHGDHLIEEIDPTSYEDKPGDIITKETSAGVEWMVNVDFENVEYLRECLEQTGLDDQFAVYNRTVFATKEALRAALKVAADDLAEAGGIVDPVEPEDNAIKAIVVREHEQDIRDWLAGIEDMDTALEQYVGAYEDLIQKGYPGAEVEVILDNGSWTRIEVNGQIFGMTYASGYDDHGEFGGAPEHISNLREKLGNDWSWLKVEK